MSDHRRAVGDDPALQAVHDDVLLQGRVGIAARFVCMDDGRAALRGEK